MTPCKGQNAMCQNLAPGYTCTCPTPNVGDGYSFCSRMITLLSLLQNNNQIAKNSICLLLSPQFATYLIVLYVIWIADISYKMISPLPMTTISNSQFLVSGEQILYRISFGCNYIPINNKAYQSIYVWIWI